MGLPAAFESNLFGSRRFGGASPGPPIEPCTWSAGIWIPGPAPGQQEWNQVRCIGAQKARTVRTRSVNPCERLGLILVYSLGDEMFKWVYRKARLSSLLWPFTEEPSELFVQTPESSCFMPQCRACAVRQSARGRRHSWGTVCTRGNGL